MRRLALPLTLIAAACSDDSTPAVTSDTIDTDDGTDPTNPGSSESGSSESGSSSGESTTAIDPTADPTTESSSTDPTLDPDSSTGEAPAVCGDGVISGNEICDTENFADNSCQSQGFMEGSLTCSQDCLGFSTHACYICGDGEIAGDEECDGPLDNDMDCESLGFTEGPINCDMSTCQLDISSCTLCGDGVAEGEEFCDMSDLFGENCDTLGFSGGQLSCHPDTCGYDYSDCQGGQYIQDWESGAIPPEFVSSGDANWLINATMPIDGSYDAHSGDINDNGTSTMTLDVVFAIDGTIDFMHREETESCCDHLQFFVDGAMLDEWSGVNAAVNTQFPITAGVHTLTWTYEKDFSISSGGDSVWIDDIIMFGGVPQ